MRGEPLPIELADVAGAILPATVSLIEMPNDRFAVSLQWAGGQFAAEANDAFSAFREVREQLAGLGLVALCYGSCRNLVLSSMCYQMSGGLKGYLARVGEPTCRADLVCIFDAGPSMDLATVAEQQEFKRMWLRSLGFGA